MNREYGVDTERSLAEMEDLAFNIVMSEVDKLYYPHGIPDDHSCQKDPDLLCPCNKRCCLFPKSWEAIE